MNSRIEAAKFEPKIIFENNIDDIKSNHMESITYFDMNISSITSNKPSSYYEHINSDIMSWIILNHLKIATICQPFVLPEPLRKHPTLNLKMAGCS